MSVRSAAAFVGVGMIAILIMALTVSSVFAATAGSATDNETAALAVSDGAAQLPIASGSAVDSHFDTVTSLDDQLRVSGGGAASISTDANISGDSWAVCTWTAATPAVESGDELRSILGFETVALYYNGSANEYVGYYYDDSVREEYAVAIAAPDPTNSSLLCLQQEQSQLTISRNTTTSSTTLANAAGAQTPPTADWNGTIEETRVYNHSLNTSQRSEWRSEPVLAVQGGAPELRVTYDVRGSSADTVDVYFASGSADLSGDARLVSGFAGPNISRGVDYDWGGLDSATISIAGNTLNDDGEVLYHKYAVSQFGGLINRAAQIGATAFGLLIIALLIKSAKALSAAFGSDSM